MVINIINTPTISAYMYLDGKFAELSITKSDKIEVISLNEKHTMGDIIDMIKVRS